MLMVMLGEELDKDELQVICFRSYELFLCLFMDDMFAFLVVIVLRMCWMNMIKISQGHW